MSTVTVTPAPADTDVIFGLSQDNIILLGAAVIGIVGSFLLFMYRLRIRRQRLRKALRTEIRVMAPDLYRHAQTLATQSVNAIQVPPDPIVMTTYENNAVELGLLSDDEITEVTKFYTIAQNLQHIDAETPLPEHERRWIRRDMIRANNQKNDALDKLEDNIKEVEKSTESGSIEFSQIDPPNFSLDNYLDESASEGDG